MDENNIKFISFNTLINDLNVVDKEQVKTALYHLRDENGYTFKVRGNS